MKKIIMVLALCLIASVAFAFDGYIEVTNDTGFDIYYLTFSHTDSQYWPDFSDDDVLGDEILYSGDTFTIWIDGKYPSSIFDIRAKDLDGDIYTVTGIDAEYDDCTISLWDIE